MEHCTPVAQRRRNVAAVALLLVALLPASAARADVERTRFTGLAPGPHAVGFEFRTIVDSTRNVATSQVGTAIGMAVWYPAASRPVDGQPLTTLDYRLLQFATPLGERARQMFEADEAAALPVWRHIGIVELTDAQAVASLHTGGVAVRGAPRRAGRYPVVVVLGGAYYLSTTAELIASHGFVVVAAVRFSDRPNDVGTAEFSWYLENSVRDAELALSTLRDDPQADTREVAAIGHGGGGMQAMLFAMRNRQVRALINVDPGNFSARSRARELAFYSPRLQRAPFLYLATAATRASQDQFEDFLAMRFSERYEVIVQNPDVRHHDLSDFGRPVTEPLRIRGTAQQAVQQVYVDVHEMIVRFLQEHAGAGAPETDRFAKWIATAPARGAYAVTAYPRVEPAPTVEAIEQTLSEATPAMLREAQTRDPDAPLFQSSNLLRIAKKAMAADAFTTATAIADFAATIYPASPLFADLKSDALERSGTFQQAQVVASACAAMPSDNDWRAAVAVRLCAERSRRLLARQ